jgi:hypothetical protein
MISPQPKPPARYETEGKRAKIQDSRDILVAVDRITLPSDLTGRNAGVTLNTTM